MREDLLQQSRRETARKGACETEDCRYFSLRYIWLYLILTFVTAITPYIESDEDDSSSDDEMDRDEPSASSSSSSSSESHSFIIGYGDGSYHSQGISEDSNDGEDDLADGGLVLPPPAQPDEEEYPPEFFENLKCTMVIYFMFKFY